MHFTARVHKKVHSDNTITDESITQKLQFQLVCDNLNLACKHFNVMQNNMTAQKRAPL